MQITPWLWDQLRLNQAGMIHEPAHVQFALLAEDLQRSNYITKIETGPEQLALHWQPARD